MLTIDYNWITGFCFGLEIFDDEELGAGVMIDLGILRVLIYNEKEDNG
jgi:hypothetical protein